MIQDIVTVFIKEFKEILQMRGTKRSGWINILVVIGVMGVYMPLMSGREWVTNLLNPISFAWLPLFLVIGVVADSFAGERERHTLETLLASRLPDASILLGKIAAGVVYSLGIGITSLLIGGVVANLGSLEEGFVYYPLDFLGILWTLSLLLALLMASLGTLVSLRASSVRQASQTLSLSILVFWVGIFLVTRFLPDETRVLLSGFVTPERLPMLVAMVVLGLVVADAVLISVAMLRFKRSRLILD